MTKPTLDRQRQLSLDLARQDAGSASGPSTAGSVVPFVDAATIAIRRDAIRRVRASGIFVRPSGDRLKA